MNNKLYVGNLSWNTKEDGLTELFSKYGTVTEVKIITDRNTGRSKGFAFVTFEKPEDADKAMAELNGKDIDGRPLKIAKALPQKERPTGSWKS